MYLEEAHGLDKIKVMTAQGPQSNFEIGGGERGTRHLFLLTLLSSKNIAPPPPPAPCSAVPAAVIRER